VSDEEPAKAIPRFAEYFRKVHVRPFNEADTLTVLPVRKSRLEKFHGVTYTEEALEFAAHSSATYLPGSPAIHRKGTSTVLGGEVAGDIKNQLGGVRGEGLYVPVGRRHDRHVGVDRSIRCIQC
jgi:AAA lid domain